MNELVKISKNKSGENTVSGRDMHVFLGIGKDFTGWIKYRIAQYGFIENTDYEIIYAKFGVNTPAGRPSVDYALTLDMAKEIAMVENNDKGRQIRRYFIEVEKAARKMHMVPQSFAEALQLAANQQLELEQKSEQIKQLTPKADYVDQIVASDDLTNMSTAAKLMNLPYGRNKLLELLRSAGIFFKNRNEPQQQHVNNGLFQIKQMVIKRKANPNKVIFVPFVTTKGMVKLRAWIMDHGFDDKDKAYAYIEHHKKEITLLQ